MHKFTFGDRVSIGFNAMGDEERERLENAVCVNSRGKVSKSKVDQANHQTEPETGTILELVIRPATEKNPEGLHYTVGVDKKNSPKPRPRIIAEEKLTAL